MPRKAGVFARLKKMTNTLLLLFPAINVIVTGMFAWMILQQYRRRQRKQQLYWSIALSMAFIATLAYIGMVIAHPTSIGGMMLFRLYYALGGSIMPAWLGLGSIALIGKEKVVDICYRILVVLSTIAFALVFMGKIDIAALSKIAGTPGTGTIEPGPWLISTIVLNTAGVVAVAGIALYSGWKLYRKQSQMGDMSTKHILWANVLIFCGAILDAVAGSLARFLGIQNTFWLIMAVGWIVLFMGVRKASQRSRQGQSMLVDKQEQTQIAQS